MSLSLKLKRIQKSLIAGVLLTILLSGIVTQLPKHAGALSVWSTSDIPAVESDSDTGAVELGAKFRSSIATTVTGVRFYKGVQNTGTHVGNLWDSSGNNLASVTFSGETASGWQEATFSNPVGISADTTYIVSYFAPNGRYSVNEGYFSGTSHTNGTLTMLQDGEDGGNGVYNYSSSSAFPDQTYNASNYWVDIITTSSNDTTPPSVNLTSPANAATISGTAVLSASASDNVEVSSVLFKVDGSSVGNPDTTSPYSVSWNSTVVQNGTHTITAVATDSAGNTTTSPPINVTTNNAQLTTTSVWPNTTTPSVSSENDTDAVELGMKFQSSLSTSVVGVKFYKGAGNNGTHIGNLWDSAGNKLATVTFSGETASGWQQASFASPIAISANTTYVISYFAPAGHYAVDADFFTNNSVSNGNLTALDDSVAGGNGVYRYGTTSGFPNQTYFGSNYWVDVLVADISDTSAPTVLEAIPANGASDVSTTPTIAAIMNEALNLSTVNSSSVLITNTVTQSAVPAALDYDSELQAITITPQTALDSSTNYTVTLTTAVTDEAGNGLSDDYTWSFTTGAAIVTEVNPLAQGHGGPILLVVDANNPFSTYYSEILRAEGLNSFHTIDVNDLSSIALNGYDAVIIGELALSDSQVAALSSWVSNGGNLVAMRPDKKLADLLGLNDQSATLNDAYLQVDTSQAPGAGIVAQTMQYHGLADLYTSQIGTSEIATLFSNSTTSTPNPAVTSRQVGTNGGKAIAFTYDLAKSVIYTHQGNPVWSGDERDGSSPIRPNDLFYGAKTGDVQPDYVNLDKVSIPQADEQQRLLANILTEAVSDQQPLPRFAYFPYNKKAVVVLVADDHATANGTISALDYQLAQSVPGCSVEDWECVRSTSLIYTNTPVTDAQALNYYNQGFDFGVHTSTGCNDWTPTSLESAIAADLNEFQAKYTSLPVQHVNRIHCIAWSTYADGAKVGGNAGLRQDLNYYYWPGSWVQNRPGFMTGSGMNMRYADMDGSLIDTYQLPSHLVNESGQTFPQNIDILLNRALGPEGYYGAFGTHYDYSDQFDRQLVQSAKIRGVPLVSGQQMLDWTDARNNSYFTNEAWNGSDFNFTVTVDTKARSMMRSMLPMYTAGKVLVSISKDGNNLPFTVETIKGVDYAVFTATSGSYSATYGLDTAAPVITNVVPANAQANVNPKDSVTISFNEPLDQNTVTGANVQLLDGTNPVAATVSYQSATNSIVIDPVATLGLSTTYAVQISSAVTDISGNQLAAVFSSQFTTAATAPTSSIWAPNPQTVSTITDSDVELGLRFSSNQNGSITGIYFYKGVDDGATSHTMTLWDASGTSLATASTTNETASGWQLATFTSPVAITSGATYTASYRAQAGKYSFTAAGLNTPVSNGSLTALASGGVYQYGGGFPTNSFNGTNYWIDVAYSE